VHCGGPIETSLNLDPRLIQGRRPQTIADGSRMAIQTICLANRRIGARGVGVAVATMGWKHQAAPATMSDRTASIPPDVPEPGASTVPIAIIGLACRFPGGADAEAFWRLLADGREALGEIPASRFAIDPYYDPDPERPGAIATRSGAFLDAIEDYDPGFFGIPPRAAAAVDPQQRLVLEVGWEALEHAAVAPSGLRERPAGVFIGVSEVDHARRAFADPAAIDLYSGAGNMAAFVAGRLAHVLGTVGPAEAIDTACSTSLVAIHRACSVLHRRRHQRRHRPAPGRCLGVAARGDHWPPMPSKWC
jgi:hypothetical protein